MIDAQMTVEQLIERLNQVTDKSLLVYSRWGEAADKEPVHGVVEDNNGFCESVILNVGEQ